jgi:glutaminyl-tRNA synthetase
VSSNFIRDIIDDDLRTGKHTTVRTRFPPEPNGYLHIGHAKAIVVDFGIAADYGGTCNLRFDDTNPIKEDVEYVESIKADIRWLGYRWDAELYASDYFGRMYDLAVQLIRDGKAYVDSSTEDEIRALRGKLGVPGTPGTDRGRSVDENLELFEGMRAGRFPDGAHVLRARIDLAASNMKMRDPLLYRIRHTPHHRTGDEWCIYPMYDYAHPLSDAFEGITHSLCTLEFENNRELYDWVVDNCAVDAKPRQIEFARLGLDYTMMSKRNLLTLVQEKLVSGWDDPRMPTLAALRRRGYTPEAIRNFVDMVGVAKANSTVDVGKLEYAVRDDLNQQAPRVMGVLDPIEVVLDNWDEGRVESIEAPYFPPDIGKPGSRQVPMTRRLLIERDDFMEEPPKKFHRLAPDRYVRLRYAGIIRCDRVEKDAAGQVTRLVCTHFDEAPGDAQVKGVIHWVSADRGLRAEVRVYDRLFAHPKPGAGGADFRDHLNPDSLVVLGDAVVEPSVADDPADTRYQFERQGYYWRDPKSGDRLVFNRIAPLRDSWSKSAAATAAEPAPEPDKREKSAKARTRPQRRSKAEIRDKIRAENPELSRRLVRYQGELGLSEDDADQLTGDLALATFFEGALAAHAAPGSVANWLLNELGGMLGDRPIGELPFTAAQFGQLVALYDDHTVSSAGAKEVLAHMLEHGGDPAEIIQDKGLRQVTDAGAIEPVVDQILAANPDKVESYRGGKAGLLGFFVGQVMKETGGTANPKLVQELLRAKLS